MNLSCPLHTLTIVRVLCARCVAVHRECSALISQYKDAESALLADGSFATVCESTVNFGVKGVITPNCTCGCWRSRPRSTISVVRLPILLWLVRVWKLDCGGAGVRGGAFLGEFDVFSYTSCCTCETRSCAGGFVHFGMLQPSGWDSPCLLWRVGYGSATKKSAAPRSYTVGTLGSRCPSGPPHPASIHTLWSTH